MPSIIQCVPTELLTTCFNLSQPSVVLVQCVSPIELLTTYFNLPQPSVMLIQCVPHRAIVNLLQPASTQCDVDPVCAPIELLTTYVLQLASLNPVWCWSRVGPHRAIDYLLQPARNQCDVDPVCVPVELLSAYFNLPQSSMMLVQSVSP